MWLFYTVPLTSSAPFLDISVVGEFVVFQILNVVHRTRVCLIVNALASDLVRILKQADLEILSFLSGAGGGGSYSHNRNEDFNDIRESSDLKKIQSEKLDFISAEYVDDDLYRWKAEIKGPENSPYEGGVFQLDIKMPKNYPIVPPAISFTTQVYHPNVGRSGNICLDYIKGGWRQENTMLTALLAIRTFLAEPNPDHPMDPIIAQQYKENKSAFEASAKSWTEKHAMRGKTIKLQEQPVTVVF